MRIQFNDLLMGGFALGISIWGIQTQAYFLTVLFGGILISILLFKFLYNENTKQRSKAIGLAGLAIALGTITSAFSYTIEDKPYEFDELTVLDDDVIINHKYIAPKKKPIVVPPADTKKDNKFKENKEIKVVFEEPITLEPVPLPEPDLPEEPSDIDVNSIINEMGLGEVEKPVIKKEKEVDEAPLDWVNVEQKPEFLGGQKALLSFLAKNTKYPAIAKENRIEGRVIIEFIVMEDGSIANAKVVRGVGGGCDEEAIRVVTSMPNWKPGMQRGKPVKVKYIVPLMFKLE